MISSRISKTSRVALLFIATCMVVNAAIFPDQGNSTKVHLRRNLNSAVQNNVPCKSIDKGNCICPGACMVPSNNTKNPSCNVKTCYGWDANLNMCVETGYAFTPAIVLQANPFTGVFGAGFGNIGHWGLFGIVMAVDFVPFILLCIGACCLIAFSGEGNTDTSYLKCAGNLFGFIWVAAILLVMDLGIVVIANGSITDRNGCPLRK